jgi:hypothetical protein
MKFGQTLVNKDVQIPDPIFIGAKATTLSFSRIDRNKKQKEELPMEVATAIHIFYRKKNTDKKNIKEKLIIIID